MVTQFFLPFDLANLMRERWNKETVKIVNQCLLVRRLISVAKQKAPAMREHPGARQKEIESLMQNQNTELRTNKQLITCLHLSEVTQ